jgi:hypothetical protein
MVLARLFEAQKTGVNVQIKKEARGRELVRYFAPTR